MKTDDFRSFMDYESELENDTVPLPQTGRYIIELKMCHISTRVRIIML